MISDLVHDFIFLLIQFYGRNSTFFFFSDVVGRDNKFVMKISFNFTIFF